MGITKRKRDLINFTPQREHVYYTGPYWPGGISEISNNPGFTSVTRQETVSEGHPFRLAGKGPDVGGSFFTTKRYIRQEGCFSHHFSTGGGINRHYTGPQYPGGYPWNQGMEAAFPAAAPASSDFDLDSAGATAIARTIPTNPVAGLATFVGELREGLPSLVGSKLLKKPGLKSSSSEYLNWQFGIKPIISDYQKFAKAHQQAGRLVKQLQRDSGKVVRRKYSFPPDKWAKVEDMGNQYPPAPQLETPLYGNMPYGHTIRTTEYERKRWFSGAYTYYVPKDDSALGKFLGYEQKCNKLLGTRVTPEVLWNLMPWSWAADWFANTGDVLHNLGAFAADGLVLRYGYMMEHTKCTVTYTYTGQYLVEGSPVTRTMSMQFVEETKKRRPATPYGFGVNVADFNPFQNSIIAALGINRVSKR